MRMGVHDRAHGIPPSPTRALAREVSRHSRTDTARRLAGDKRARSSRTSARESHATTTSAPAPSHAKSSRTQDWACIMRRQSRERPQEREWAHATPHVATTCTHEVTGALWAGNLARASSGVSGHVRRIAHALCHAHTNFGHDLVGAHTPSHTHIMGARLPTHGRTKSARMFTTARQNGRTRQPHIRTRGYAPALWAHITASAPTRLSHVATQGRVWA